MKHNKLKGLDKSKLRRWLLWFFLSLTIPTTILIQQSFSRLRWEAFHQHQLLADELTNRINGHFLRLMASEEQRPFGDYAFLNVLGQSKTNFSQRSPLSNYPVQSEIPGLIGYFQVDAAGKLMTPLMPEGREKAASYGIGSQELADRSALQSRIQQILSENRLVKNQYSDAEKRESTVKTKNRAKDNAGLASNEYAASPVANAPAPEPEKSIEGQAAFDELKKSAPAKMQSENKLGRLEDLQLKQSFKPAISKALSKMRKEESALPETLDSANMKADAGVDKKLPAPQQAAKTNSLPIRTFEGAIDPFEFSQLDSGHFVIFRKVWLNGQRYIQGLLVEQSPFLQNIVNAAFRETVLSQMSDLLVVYRGDVLSAFTGRTSRGYLSSQREISGELLYQARLSDPFSDMQLLFSITQLPIGPGGLVIIWLTAVLAVVFCAGFYGLYRLGVGQISLVNQQQDFISAVSHELKTPLTSIRMYAEMLQAGWVDEAKKKTYYDFIFAESERLSRLINNVLQLAKMTRNEKQPVFTSVTVAELMDSVKSKVSSQVELAGFTLAMQCDQNAASAIIKVNPDWFIQIMINLVDNAIKFSAKAEHKTIQLDCVCLSSGHIQFSVRDFGPGVAKDQMQKIFKLFYRSENEMTRETVGTGIGLALAHQMTVGMQGQIDVLNKAPGAEFRVKFPVI
jgi:signal transduction histidine kinase